MFVVEGAIILRPETLNLSSLTSITHTARKKRTLTRLKRRYKYVRYIFACHLSLMSVLETSL